MATELIAEAEAAAAAEAAGESSGAGSSGGGEPQAAAAAAAASSAPSAAAVGVTEGVAEARAQAEAEAGGGGDAAAEAAAAAEQLAAEMKRKLEDLEDLAKASEKISEQQNSVRQEMNNTEAAIEAHSVFVGQVDYEATPEELQAHFAPCGGIKRVTILCDKYTQRPKGYAYVEFESTDGVENALKLNESLLRGRPIKVMPKRQNQPGFRGSRGRGRGRRGGFRGRRGGGRYRGGGYYGGYNPHY